MNRKSMIKALNKKIKEMLLRIEELYPGIEIRNFDQSLAEKAVSLVEDIVYKLHNVYWLDKYKFSYYFLLSLTGGKFIVSYINLSITDKKFTHSFDGIVYQTSSPKRKPLERGKNGVLFLEFYNSKVRKYSLEIENFLKKLAVRERIYFHKGFESGFGYGNPFPESYYSFEIPFDVEVLEYII